jgi:hypothetical protein
VLVSSCSIPSDLFFGIITVPSNSSLVFADANISLHTSGMKVYGHVIAGSETCRLWSHLNITFHGSRPQPTAISDAFEWTKGAWVTGTLDLHGALYASTWSRIAADVRPGDSWIFLQEGVNWQPGQRVLITTTSYKDARDYHENEIFALKAVLRVSADSSMTAIQLDGAVRYRHYAGKEYQAEVALLSRNIVVQGSELDSEPSDTTPVSCTDNQIFSSYACGNKFLTGYGGHLMIMGEAATGRLSGVQLYRMGQTNVLGRYPIHFHQVGEGGARSFVQDSSIWHSFYRCVSVHGTNSSRVSRNVAHDVSGFCYYLEDGVVSAAESICR